MAVKNLGVVNRYEIRDGQTVSRTAIPAEKNRMMNKTVWFDIGQTIKNGAGEDVPMTVGARTRLEYEDCLAKGWTPIEDVEILPPPPAPVPGVTKRTRKNGR